MGYNSNNRLDSGRVDMAVEVEIKLKIEEPQRLTTKLEALGFVTGER